ncbi:MAG: 4-(cytidine 5'-diphospho)-2-C-methyl-D-erythritol kinase [Deinococcota bacterium]|nr:4-(cytidine 5'-diphospho)-2-C-methyl-D-erythritol kinase [Deinococcota bacterium]
MTLSLKAHAKVNLGLHVLGRREDGYHELDTVFARLELHDTVELEAGEEGIGLEVGGADLAVGRDNLAYRAAERYLGAAGLTRGVRIRLAKRIPVAAGLGGGSSDAAAVLRGLARLYPGDLDLLELGRELGADVPFFVKDWPAARAQGIGQRLSPLELPSLHLVLVNPGVQVSARSAYGWLGDDGGYDGPLEPAALVASLETRKPGYRNSLQRVVLAQLPVIGEVLGALEDTDLRGPLMSGSGATCFGLASSAEHAEHAAADLRQEHPAWWACPTFTS